ncbi:MAG: hypothetical protein ACLFPQ_02315 [Candidatus Woesearchaeota archaeon]
MGLFDGLKKILGKKHSQPSISYEHKEQTENIMNKYHDEKSSLLAVLEETKKKASEFQQNEDFFSETKKKEISVLDKLTGLLNEIAEKDKIDLDNENISSVKEFCKHFDENIKSFIDSSEFDFSHTKQILATEINHIRNSLEKIEKYIAELKVLLEKSGNDPETKNKITDFEKKIENIEKDEFPKLNEKFSVISDDTSYGDLLKNKDSLRKKQKAIETDLRNRFFAFEDVLREFHNQNSDIGIAGLYLNDPLSALMNDENLEILDHINKISSLVKRNRIECDNPKKTVEALKTISKEYLLSTVSEHKKADEAIESISNTMKEHHIDDYSTHLQERIKELASKTQEITQNIHRLEINMQEKQLKKIDNSIKETKKELDE